MRLPDLKSYFFAYFVSFISLIGSLLILSKLLTTNTFIFPYFFSILLSFIISFSIFRLLTKRFRVEVRIQKTPFPEKWKKILVTNVVFYNNLSKIDKFEFEKRIQLFVTEKRITGIKTQIEDLDRLLVASSAIIPVFGFKNWKYNKLNEVLLYPDTFDDEFKTNNSDKANILGMVGEGNMNRMMILSQPALRLGFQNSRDKKNVGIHEFVHLIDMADGAVDGIPSLLLENQYSIPWLNLIKKEIEKICQNKSGINPYGATNKQEFFAVASEYFFERPHLLKQKHPELFDLLNQIFKQNITDTIKNNFRRKQIGRNSKCLCGSNIKYKNCCGKLVKN